MKNTRIEKGITQKSNRFQAMLEKVIATIVIYLIFSNTMLPTMLSKVYADEAVTIEPNKEGKYAILEVNYSDTNKKLKNYWQNYRIAEIDLKLVGDIPVSGAQFEFNYDSSILTPYVLVESEETGELEYVEADSDTEAEWNTLKFPNDGGIYYENLNTSTKTIEYEVTRKNDINPYNQKNGEIIFAKMKFKIKDGYDINKLPKNAITLKFQSGLPTGYNIAYNVTSDNDKSEINDIQYFGYKGFDANSKVVKKANIDKYPTKTTYISGEKIDLTGGTLKVTYDNDTTESIKMTDKDVTLVNDTADLNNPTLILKYKGLAVEEDIPITVKDVVTSIQIVNTPTKLEYKQGDTIDYAGGMIQVNYKSGQQKFIGTDNNSVIKDETIADLTKGDVTILGQSKDGLDFGSKTLTIEYEGQKATFDILINDSIDKIEAKDYKVNYKIGDTEIDRTQGKVVATTKSGAEYDIPFANETLEFKNFKSYEEMHDRPITVSYMGMSTTFNINVLDYETGITINTLPNKLKYECGEDLDLTGGIIKVLKASGNAETIQMTDSRINVTGFNTNESGDQTLIVKYKNYSSKFDVNVIDKLDEIEIDETPKTEYCIGDKLDYSKGTIKARYLSKKTMNGISLGEDSVKVTVDTSKLGKQTATVSYTEEDVTKTTTYDVNVVDKVKTMTITKQPKTQFNFGDDLENIGGELYVEYESSEPATIPITADMITEEDGTPFITRVKFENEKTSLTKNAKINYRNESITIPVTIKNNPVSIKVTKNPDKTKYYYGDNELDLTGGELTITRANEKEEVLKLTDPKITVTGFNSSKANDDLKLKVTYKEETYTLTTDLDLSVEDTLQKIELVATPKKEYYYGDKVENAKVNVTRLSGTKMQEITPTGFDSTKLGKQTLTVSVEDKKITYDVTVLDKATTTLVEPTKLSYYKGEKLDLTNGKIVEHYLSGKDKDIPLTSDMITGFDSNKLGKQTLKVKYNETEFTFNVEVQEKKTELKPTKKVTKDNTKETPTNTVTTVTSVKSEKPKASTTIKKTKTIKTTPVTETSQPTEETTNEEQEKTEMKPAQEETKKEKENKDKGNTIVGSVNDNNSNKPDQTQKDGIKNTIFGIIALFALFVLYAIDKNKNVRIYVESGDDRILVGREKITKEDRKLDLGKYYERYGEETFDIVLDKDISEKLDKKQVNVTVNNSKKEKFEVNYNNEEYTYKTKA